MSKTVKIQKPGKEGSKLRDIEMSTIQAQDIFGELEIQQRTQRPPSADLIARLNEIASKPPFSFIHKVKEHETR